MSSRIGTCGAVFSKGHFLFILVLLLGTVSEGPCLAQPSVGGAYEYYAAVGVKSNLPPYAIRSRLRLRGRFAGPWFMAYSSFRVSSAIADPERGGYEGPVRTRLLEGFLDLYFDRLDVRIGHQLVVWGQMDGVFITDVVSPLDLTEFLAQDFTDIRLAVPAIKASYYLDDWSVTGLIVVAPVKSLLPSRRSPWFVLPKEAASFDVVLGNDNLPRAGLGQMEPGLKVTYSGTSTTLDLIYFYGRNRIPVFSKSLDLTPGSPARLILYPDYSRRHVIGSRLSSTMVQPIVVEAEVAYESIIKVDLDPALVAVNPAGLQRADGYLVDQGQLAGGISAARTYHRTLVKTQLVGSLLTRYDERVARDRFYGAVTLLVRSLWDNDLFAGSVFAYYNPGGDYWLNPVLQYSAAPGLNLFVGTHVFGGKAGAGNPATAAFGLFDDNDFAYIRVTLAF